VGEDVGFVKMEIVDDIRIAQGFEEHQIVVVRPARPRRNDGVDWGSLTNRSHQLRLYSIPAITVRHFRFVENFEKHMIRVPGRVVCRQHPPEIGKLLDGVIVFCQLLLEVAFRMDVDHNRQPAVEDHLDRVIQKTKIVQTNGGRTIHGKQGLRIHAQAHVIETHRFYEGNIFRGNRSFEVFLGVTLGIIDLGKPSAGIDAVPQTSRAALGNSRRVHRGSLRRKGAGQGKNGQGKNQVEVEKAAQPAGGAHALHVSQGRGTGRAGSRRPLHSRLLELFFDFLQYSGGDRLLKSSELRQLTETQAQFLRLPAFRLPRRLTLAHRMAQFRSGGCVKAF
jgi:hypothetical protein